MIASKLDDRVESELRRRIIIPDLNVSFYRRRIPGKGYFEISSTINGASFEYSRQPQEIVLTLMKGSDIINVYSNGKIVTDVWVNDRRYRNPEVPVCGAEREKWTSLTEEEEDAEKVITLGKTALDDIHNHLRGFVPGLVRLMDEYFSGKLVPADDLQDLRSYDEIFRQFDLKLRRDLKKD